MSLQAVRGALGESIRSGARGLGLDPSSPSAGCAVRASDLTSPSLRFCVCKMGGTVSPALAGSGWPSQSWAAEEGSMKGLHARL